MSVSCCESESALSSQCTNIHSIGIYCSLPLPPTADRWYTCPNHTMIYYSLLYIFMSRHHLTCRSSSCWGHPDVRRSFPDTVRYPAFGTLATRSGECVVTTCTMSILFWFHMTASVSAVHNFYPNTNINFKIIHNTFFFCVCVQVDVNDFSH